MKKDFGRSAPKISATINYKLNGGLIWKKGLRFNNGQGKRKAGALLQEQGKLYMKGL